MDTVRAWVTQDEVDTDQRPGTSTTGSRTEATPLHWPWDGQILRQEVVRMRPLTQVFRWTGRKLRRLRSLVRDDDRDPWYDDHNDPREPPPNVGPQLSGGG